MAKILIVYTLIIFFFFSLASSVLAAPDIGLKPGGMVSQVAARGGYGQVTDTTLSESVGRIIKIALSLIGTIFLALTIYAGILWMTAGGKEEQVESATKILRAAVIGLIIVVAAYGITIFVLIAVTSATGLSSDELGAGQGGAAGFWSSFGQNFKDNWYRYVF